jgi:phage terminase small subunit
MAISLDLINQTNEATLSDLEKKFCEGIAAGKGKREAAIEAGYSPTSAHVQAARNLKKDKIIQYIDRLRTDVRRLTNESVSKEVERLDLLIKDALKDSQYSAAVNAIRLKAQLLGFLVEKKEIKTNSLDAMNEEELTQYLTQIRVDHGLLIDDAGGLIIGDQVDDVDPQQQAATVLTDPQGSGAKVNSVDHSGSLTQGLSADQQGSG